MERRVGDDLRAVEGEERQDLGVVDLAAPALDQGAVVDAVPGEAAHLLGEVVEELVQGVDVILGKRANEKPASVPQHGLHWITIRHSLLTLL